MSKKSPKVDPSLLPHPRPCWCIECDRAYHQHYVAPMEYRYLSTCEDCGGECSRKAKRCQPCANARRVQPVTVKIVLRRCDCGAVLTGKKSVTQCRSCYLDSNAKVRRTRHTCEYCYRSWLSKMSEPLRFCSKQCERESSLGLLAFMKKPVESRGERGTCGRCGARCEKYVCTDCTKKVRKIHVRIYNNRKRGAQIFGPYDRIDIAVRDGWICHLCTGSVAPHLWGTRGSDAPVIDHVIPISRGGPDTAENVKLAHWSCNSKKGNRMEGERGGTRTKREGRSSDAQAA